MNVKLLSCTFISSFLLMVSCTKAVDSKISGAYKGMIRYKLYQYPNEVIPIKDTLFTDIVISVSQSADSKRKAPKINLNFNTSQIEVSPTNDIPITNGQVTYYTSEKGAAISNKWNGTISDDSLKLIFRREDHIRFVSEYIFTAKKD